VSFYANVNAKTLGKGIVSKVEIHKTEIRIVGLYKRTRSPSPKLDLRTAPIQTVSEAF